MPTMSDAPALERPRKSADELRSSRLETRLLPLEEQQLRALAKSKGVRFTEFVRQTVLAADLTNDPPAHRLRMTPRQGGLRRQILLTFAQGEEIRFKANDVGLSLSDYLYRSLVRLLDAHQEEFLKAARPKAAKNQPTAEEANRLAEIEAANLESVIKLDRLVKELNAIGVNLNQLTHKANAGKVLPGLIAEAKQEISQGVKHAHQVLEEVAAVHVSNRA